MLKNIKWAYKNFLKKEVNPAEVSPASTPKPTILPSEQIVGGLSNLAATVSALAVTSGFSRVGAVCSVIVTILKVEGK